MDIPNRIIIFIANIIILLGISSSYDMPIRRTILVTIYVIVICGAVESFMVEITGYITFSTVSVAEYSSIFGIISVNVANYIVGIILNNLKNIKEGYNVSVGYWCSLAFVTISTFYLLIVIYTAGVNSSIKVISSALIVGLLNFVMFKMYEVLSLSFEKQV